MDLLKSKSFRRWYRVCSMLVLGLTCCALWAQPEVNTTLMKSTFEIIGPGSEPGSSIYGTVFLVGKPVPGQTSRYYNVLVTAAHVLNGITGDTAKLLLHAESGDGTYAPQPFTIQIRKSGHNLYTISPGADVAVMYVSLPKDNEPMLIPMSWLIDDADLQKFDLHPGDQLSCLGFPLAINLDGFPVIRTGVLASYPLTPSRKVQRFYYTFHVFPGNSGGPVYFSYLNRNYGGSLHVGQMIMGIVGLVSQQENSRIPRYAEADMDIAVVVPSAFIKDTVSLLPTSPPDQ